jgi:hypothetical protein
MARWQFYNILHVGDGANRLWQFDAKSGGFTLNREHHAAPGESLPFNVVAKTWRSLWQPKLNVAWLPSESVFFRVIELPRSNFEETLAMTELQLEKLSPMPVTQIVWTIHVLSRHSDSPRRSKAETGAKADAPTAGDDLQTVVVVIAARHAVEEFLGKLEGQGYLADRLEAPMLDQLEAMLAMEDGLSRQNDPARRSETETGTTTDAWIYPSIFHGQNAALVAWWQGGALRNLSVIVLPPGGDPAKDLREQLTQLTWAGELEGWLTASLSWHLVAEGTVAAEWENALRVGLGETVHVAPPLPLEELAARTARRSAEASTRVALLPQEFSARYRQQFFDRLWMRGLIATGVLYVVGVLIYFCAVGFLAIQTHKVEEAAAFISGSYTNALALQARYGVLKERQDLKYAALDCWKIVAERLPEGISLLRFSFADGRKLSLSGTCTPDQIGLISDQDHFYDGVRKAKLNGQPMFDQNPGSGEQLTYRQNGNAVTWNFGLELQRSEAEPQ